MFSFRKVTGVAPDIKYSSSSFPINISEESSHIVHGNVARGYEKVRNVFEKQIEKGNLPGNAIFTGYVKGEQIFDLKGNKELHFSDDTLKNMDDMQELRNTKKLVNLCGLLLVDRKVLKYNAPVGKYWPEFKQHGKENITVSDIFSEKSGLEVPLELLHSALMQDNKKLSQFLARQKPNPIITHGFLEGELEKNLLLGSILYGSELIHRTDFRGRSLTQFLKDEISKPFNIQLEQADSMAKLFSALAHDVKINGKPFLGHPDIMKQALLPANSPIQKSITVGGFVKPFLKEHTNGFSGSGTWESYGDLDRGLGLSLVGVKPSPLNRFEYQNLVQAVYDCMDLKRVKYN